ncbi:DNA-processing protein DprA [Inquilinus sp. CAU 1745]|uniref:DNA-processing protein DprA n=1 Tax=Inquilinus sp. CAU 1745 TaxID=3140369 RepID=UPI00325B3E52
MIQPRRALSDSERRDWLRLIRTEHVGPIAFRILLRRCGDAGAALDALPEMARFGGQRGAKPFGRAEADREMEAVERLGGRMIALCEPDYPPMLAAIEDAPPVITVLGDASLLSRPQVGIVGARTASTNGRRFAETLARDLGQEGMVVASGLARGIDAAAHAGALPTGTVAVVGGGVDAVYPAENRALHERIAAEGAIVAEQALGVQPKARHFPRRNRLISGLSRGIVVVEAALRSGSLITARMAAEQGREVFAVPGFPGDPRAEGGNRLIREGATLIRSAADVLEDLAGIGASFAETGGDYGVDAPDPAEPGALEQARSAVTGRLSPSPTPVDELVRDCQLSASAVLTALLELELAGRIERQPGNRVALVGTT